MITLGAELDRVLADLVVHRIDLVIADTPMPSNVDLKACSQLNWRRFV
jgi:LysR family transcriptional activator of nhaA